MSAAEKTETPPSSTRRLGKYELIERIGVGGMAEVHLARMLGPMGFRKVVVVKTIHPNLASQSGFLEMLLDEAKVSALIKHPRVVDIYDLGCVDGQYFIAMEYLDGQPLSQLMSAGAGGRPLDIYSTSRIIADAAEGLHAAHELKSMSGKPLDLVHRDVSPGNIIVLYDGSVKLVDFGVAKARGRLSQSGVEQLKGKLGYMAPEQIANRTVDRRSDIFSLGVVMWEALALTRLFPPDQEAPVDEAARQVALLGVEPPSVHRRELPEALDAICLRALAPGPDDRFQTADEMKRAIDGVLEQVGYRREAGLIARYARQTFSKRRRRRSALLRRLGSESGEYYPEEDSEPGGEPSSAASTVNNNARPRRGLRIAALLLLLGLVAGGAVLYQKGELPWLQESQPAVTANQHPSPPVHKTAASEQPAPDEKTAPVAGDTPEVRPPDEPETSADQEPDAKESDQEPDERPARADADKKKRDDKDKPDKNNEDKPDENNEDKPDENNEDKPDKADARALYREGMSLFVRGNLGAAKRRFQEALRINRGLAQAHRGLGLIYQARGKKRRAIRAFKRYLRLRPNAGDAAKIKARLAALQK